MLFRSSEGEKNKIRKALHVIELAADKAERDNMLLKNCFNKLENTKTKNIYGGSSGSLLTNWKSSFFPKRLGKIKTHRFRDYPNT